MRPLSRSACFLRLFPPPFIPLPMPLNMILFPGLDDVFVASSEAGIFS